MTVKLARFERPHRVRLYTEAIHFNETVKMDAKTIYWQCAKNFSKTDEYKWAADNEITLEYTIDDSMFNWHKTVMFYSDLSDQQYTDYALRFFQHMEEWK